MISILNITTGDLGTIPFYPIDGEINIERPRAVKEFPVIGSRPIVQILAVGARRLSIPLVVYGDEGEQFYRDVVLRAYGRADSGLKPHEIIISWGAETKDTFTGFPVDMPTNKITLGKSAGRLTNFSYAFSWNFIEISNSIIRQYTQDGRLVITSQPVRKYTVVQGDDLQKICKKFNCSLTELADLNDGTLPPRPRVGLIINVPNRGNK
jgi:hypothetical protein